MTFNGNRLVEEVMFIFFFFFGGGGGVRQPL